MPNTKNGDHIENAISRSIPIKAIKPLIIYKKLRAMIKLIVLTMSMTWYMCNTCTYTSMRKHLFWYYFFPMP